MKRSCWSFALVVAALLAAGCHGGAPVSMVSTSSRGGAGGTGGMVDIDAGPTGGASPEGGCVAMDAGAADAATGCEGVSGAVSYAADVAPIFAENCSGELCHAPPTRSSTVNVPASQCCDGRLLVEPGNAARSYLVDKLGGHDLCAGGQMPLAEPPLPDAEQAVIVRWICAGALDD